MCGRQAEFGAALRPDASAASPDPVQYLIQVRSEPNPCRGAACLRPGGGRSGVRATVPALDPYATPARRLSSAWTTFFKIIFPILWIIWLLSSGVAIVRWLFPVIMLGGLVMIYFFCLRLKWVDLHGDMLVISDVQRKITVPLHDVERFSGSILISPELIWIHFLRTTEFGDKVIFMAPLRLFQGFSPHPLVDELNALRTEAGPSPWNTAQT